MMMMMMMISDNDDDDDENHRKRKDHRLEGQKSQVVPLRGMLIDKDARHHFLTLASIGQVQLLG